MPRYYFKCDCGNEVAVLRSVSKKDAPETCKKCQQPMKRNPRGASSRIVETRDNGLMSRRVEQPANVEERMWERAHLPEDRKP